MARVLVVDDEPDLRDLLRMSLGLAGHEVSVASDGHKGLASAREQRPDVVVLDVMMPGLDGWTVLSSLKSDPDPHISSIPVLMLTARAEDLDMVRGGIEGAIRYLTKPFAISDLRQAVADAVAGGPEPEQRRAAQNAALAHLARLERGTGPQELRGATQDEPARAGERRAYERPPEPAWQLANVVEPGNPDAPGPGNTRNGDLLRQLDRGTSSAPGQPQLPICPSAPDGKQAGFSDRPGLGPGPQSSRCCA